MMHKVIERFRLVVVIIRNEGFAALLIRVLQRSQRHRQQSTTVQSKKKQIHFLVKSEDVVKAEWSSSPFKQPKTKHSTGRTFAWVMSPPGASSGGHQNLFRFIKSLDERGYTNKIYLYSTADFPTAREIRERITGYYDLKLENVAWLKNESDIKDCDAIFATGWETAYPVFNARRDVKKFYFVQDFEPLFYPMGSEYILAENTYRFNFIGITAGGWLKQKLSNDYGMKCYSYDFGSEKSLYELTNTEARKDVFFYARPVTTRRGFELGLLTLQKFHQQHPDYTIHFAGWDVAEYDIPFPYVNHKAMQLEELAELYNKCAVALVISLTNMSLLPLELLACGVIPVVNDAENNRLVSNNPNIKYAQPSPDAMAQAMHEVVVDKKAIQASKQAADSVGGASWKVACQKVYETLESEMTNNG